VIADAECREVIERVQDILLVGAGLANCPRDERGGMRRVDAAGILPVAAVDDIGQRRDDAAAVEANGQQAFEIDAGDQLAVAKIGKDFVAKLAWHLEGETDAGAAAIQAEHQPGPFGRSAVDEGRNAERAAVAV
jgi:hypothetical protein